MKKLKDITPEKFKCAGITCPAIYNIEGRGQMVIVGKKLDQ